MKPPALTYNTGKPCKRGHLADRYVSTRACVECSKLVIKAWWGANPERGKELHDNHYRLNREKIRARRNLRYSSDSEFRERVLENGRRYHKENPEKRKAASRRRRALKAGAEGSHTEHDLFCILVMQDAQCNGCGASLMDDRTEDHMTPLSRGGSDWPDNIQVLCLSCNDSKGRKTMEEWRKVA